MARFPSIETQIVRNYPYHVKQKLATGTSQPSANSRKKIAKCFGVTTDWLLFEDSESGPVDDLRLQFDAAMGQFTFEQKGVARAVLEGMLLGRTGDEDRITGAVARHL